MNEETKILKEILNELNDTIKRIEAITAYFQSKLV